MKVVNKDKLLMELQEVYEAGNNINQTAYLCFKTLIQNNEIKHFVDASDVISHIMEKLNSVTNTTYHNDMITNVGVQSIISELLRDIITYINRNT